uniref:DNA-directed RNA polymerase II subunit RPB1 n=1 Tax=Anthurium amnicola TaxID=1678845 RepID=A0A1D1XNM8_9ARAE
MGKPTEDDQVRDDPESSVEGAGVVFCRCSGGLRGIRGAVTFRCVLMLLLGACVLLFAVFWLPPFRTRRSGSGAGGADKLSASIQASFILEKPTSVVAAYTGQLEYDIFEEIGVPNTKVSIIDLYPLTASNSTNVVFGVLPDSNHAVISPVVLSVLKSSLIDLVLQQSNLSLTSSIFGQPSSFEVLKFPGGITVIPIQSASIWQITQILFNFTLNNSIIQIQKNLDELKGQLKFGLNLRSYENVYVQVTNLNGSTVAPPVIVEASVLSDLGSRNLLPPRLKQLAQTITGTPAKNLGLDHSVFGKVKEVRLSSYLNNSITSLESPSPAPSPSDEPPDLAPGSTHTAVSPSYAPTPSTNSGNVFPCLNCGTSPLSPPLHSATPQDWPQPPSPQYSSAPSPSVTTTVRAPRHSPCIFHKFSPDASPVIHSHPPVSNKSPHAIAPSQQKPQRSVAKMAPPPHRHLGPTPEMSWGLSPNSPPTVYNMSPQYSKRSGESGQAANSPIFSSSPTSPSPSWIRKG